MSDFVGKFPQVKEAKPSRELNNSSANEAVWN